MSTTKALPIAGSDTLQTIRPSLIERLAAGKFGFPPDTPTEILIDDGFDRLAPYRPCFAAQVRDLAGTTREVEPVCLDVIVPPARGPSSSGGGCQVTGTAAGEGVASCLAFLALLLRRMSRPAARRA